MFLAHAPRINIPQFFSAALAFSLPGLIIIITACASSGSGKKDKLEVPVNMPEICRGLDFNLNVEMREVCGVKVRNYRSYKNIQQYRVLLRPKGGKIVKKGKSVQLRLNDMLPAELPTSWGSKLNFTEETRTKYLKSKWDYQEFIPEGGQRPIKIMKIDVPMHSGKMESACFTILPKRRKAAKIQSGSAQRLEPLDCAKFYKLKKKASGS